MGHSQVKRFFYDPKYNLKQDIIFLISNPEFSLLSATPYLTYFLSTTLSYILKMKKHFFELSVFYIVLLTHILYVLIDLLPSFKVILVLLRGLNESNNVFVEN